MAHYKYVIVGGGIAGGMACEGIRQVDSSGSIAVVAMESHRPYQRPPLSKKYLRDEAGLDEVYLHPAEHYAQNQIELFQGVKAESLDTTEREVYLANGTRLEYDRLLIATGGRARRLDIPGTQLRNVFTLRSIADAQAIRAAARAGGRVLVMGGSFIGAEVAASLNQMGLQVTQVFPGTALFERILPELITRSIHEMFEQHGVRLLPGVTAKELEGAGTVQRARLDQDESIEVDMVVMGVGIDLNTELAGQAGIELDPADRAIIVDGFLRTSDEAIYAAGDIVSWPDPTFQRRLRVEHWDTARRQGLQAGRNMAGAGEKYTAMPNFFSDTFEMSLNVWGNLSHWDATVIRGVIESRNFTVFYFERGAMTGALLCGRPKEEKKLVQQLIQQRLQYEQTAALLADETKDLTDLAASNKAEAGR